MQVEPLVRFAPTAQVPGSVTGKVEAGDAQSQGVDGGNRARLADGGISDDLKRHALRYARLADGHLAKNPPDTR